MRRVVVAVAALLLAGCLGTAEEPEETETTPPPVLIDAARPKESFGDIVTGPAVGPDLNATTQQAPRLAVGEWWRVRFDSYLNDVVEVVRVVANITPEGYIFGMPHEGWLKEAISFHSPAFGDVNQDLSYNTHNVLFEPVRFPLTPGDSWETAFATQPYTATVDSVDEYTAIIVMKPIPPPEQPTDPVFEAAGLSFVGGGMRLTYDARMHEVVKMESELGTWEVVEHGYDYEGWVTVPRGEHTAIDYGVFGGPVGETHDPLPREITVEGGFNRLTMMHLAVGVTPGSYRIRDVAPDGVEFVTESMGDFTLAFYESSSPDGVWTVEDHVVGVGATYSMGIAYHQYDIRLPDGARRADHSHPVIR